MKMIKRAAAILLAAVMLAASVSCGETATTEYTSGTASITNEVSPVSNEESLSSDTDSEVSASGNGILTSFEETDTTVSLTVSLTEPSTEPSTEPLTEPSTEPVTEPSTEPVVHTETPLSTEEEDRAFLSRFNGKYELTGENKPYYLGRWFEKDGCMATFTAGSTMWFLIDGSTYFDMRVEFTTTDDPYYSCMIDGGEPFRRPVSEPRVLLPDNGRHLIRIMADGVDYREDRWEKELGLYVEEIVPGEKGRICGVKPTNKTVFFYGDSITEGICVLGSTSSCKTNSALFSYPYICSEQLGFTPYFIAYCGTGILSKDNMSFFRNLINNISKTRKLEEDVVPDLIVINHGTNDNKSTTNAEFENELRKALDTLRARYPGVPVVMMIPLIQAKAAVIRRVAKDYEDMYVIETMSWDISKVDHLHPNKAGAEKMGMLLSSELVRIFGNDFFR